MCVRYLCDNSGLQTRWSLCDCCFNRGCERLCGAQGGGGQAVSQNLVCCLPDRSFGASQACFESGVQECSILSLYRPLTAAHYNINRLCRGLDDQYGVQRGRPVLVTDFGFNRSSRIFGRCHDNHPSLHICILTIYAHSMLNRYGHVVSMHIPTCIMNIERSKHMSG